MDGTYESTLDLRLPPQRLDRAFLRYLWRWPTVTRPLVASQLRAHGADEATIVLPSRRAARRLLEQVRRAGVESS
jgi:hypothetical protein